MTPRLFLHWLPLLCFALASLTSPRAAAADWQIAGEPETSVSAIHPSLSYSKRVLRRVPDGKTATVQLALFSSLDFRLEVIDLGDGSAPVFSTVRDALQKNGCAAGVNGGFFMESLRPYGLMVAQGQRVHRLESAKLLSGVIYCDANGIHLVRRAAFADHPQITALLQTGPYLIEHGTAVRGLSPANPDRRTFIATDWRRNWALGTCSSLTLEELADLLQSSPAVTGWKIDRAINLDGGTSSAFYFDRPGQEADVSVSNWKRIRNVVGLAPKR